MQFAAPPTPGRYTISAVRDQLIVFNVMPAGPRKDLFRLKTKPKAKKGEEDLVSLGHATLNITAGRANVRAG